MKSRLLRLFNYNDWANEQVSGALCSIPGIPDHAVKLMSHIIASQDVWLERVQGTHNWSIQFWDIYTAQECMVLSSQSSKDWLKFIRKCRAQDFDRLIRYKNSKGNEYETPFIEIAEHVLFHSAYHRGQINLILRGGNIEPVKTDFIYFTRI